MRVLLGTEVCVPVRTFVRVSRLVDGVSETLEASRWDRRVGSGTIGWVLYLLYGIWGNWWGRVGGWRTRLGWRGGTDTGGG